MNARKYSPIAALATGVVVLVLISLGLFWARWYCGLLRHGLLSRPMRRLEIRPSRLVPSEGQYDPNTVVFSHVSAEMALGPPQVIGLGVGQYVQTQRPEGLRSRVYLWDPRPDGERCYFDQTLGKIVNSEMKTLQQPDGSRDRKRFTVYAGSEGIAETPGGDVGTFVDPLPAVHARDGWVVYDRALRRFFKIQWRHKIVAKGPELPEEGPYRPVQIGTLLKNHGCIDMEIGKPRALAGGQQEGDESDFPSVLGGITSLGYPLLVLDASGRIDRLDTETLELTGTAGRLPAPQALFGSKPRVTPDDVFAYRALPTFVRRPGDEDWVYTGCAVASLSREGTAMRMEVFDPNGRPIAAGDTRVDQHVRLRASSPVRPRSVSTAKAALTNLPGAQVLAGMKLALENLHPPVLSLASHLTASSFEATVAFRSLFLLPNSFVAMAARGVAVGPIERFTTGLFFMAPSLGFSALLAWLIGRDGKRIGLERRTRSIWIGTTVAFGLPAYITYRLMRPRVVLVTCQNCGRGRRPDLEKCHLCGSPWHVPELVPPAWRVLDGALGIRELPGPEPPGPPGPPEPQTQAQADSDT